jgi:hypothetical protein
MKIENKMENEESKNISALWDKDNMYNRISNL